MKKTKKQFIWVSITVAILLILSGLALPSVLAQTPVPPIDSTLTQRMIHVSGTGSVNVQPDTAYVVVGVRTEATEASAALTQNNQQMTSLINALKQTGISDANIQTQFINLSPRYSNQTPTSGQPQVTGYIATNTVQVKLSNITQVGGVLDAAVQAGANLIENIRFEVGNPQPLIQQAREQAYNNALQKAQQLARLAGVQLGEVISISETSTLPPRPLAVGGSASSAVQAVPVQPGTQNIQMDIQVTWAIMGGSAVTPGTTTTPLVPQTGGQQTVTPTAISTLIVPATPAASFTVVPITPGANFPPVATAGTPTLSTPDLTFTPVIPLTGGTQTTPSTTTVTPAANETAAASQLRSLGADVKLVGTIQQPFFPVKGQILNVNGDQIQVFEFSNTTGAQQATSAISRANNQLGGFVSQIFSTPQFFQKDNLVVLYVGNDPGMLDLLSRAFGNPLNETP